MQQVFSPRQVAKALGASESSVKRWCDRGVLPTIKTAGGHRRLPLAGVLEFIRCEKRMLFDPLAIGLPQGLGSSPRSTTDSHVEFKEALGKGDADGCRRILLELTLSQEPVSRVFDEVVTPALRGMGDDWCDGKLEVFQERRGCEIFVRLIHEMRSMMPQPPADAPVAMGGSLAQDPYALPNNMVELSLIELGWNATSLGCGIPIDSLISAVQKHRPRLFWLSLSVVGDIEAITKGCNELHAACGDDTALVLGGRGLTDEIRQNLEYTAYCESMQRLASFAMALHPTNRKFKNGKTKSTDQTN